MAAAVVRRVQQLQEQRVAVYRVFTADLEAFLVTGDEALYQRAITSVTGRFQDVSDGVRQAADELGGRCERGDLADVVRELQQAERVKLELTVRLHVARKAAADARMHRRGAGAADAGEAGAGAACRPRDDAVAALLQSAPQSEDEERCDAEVVRLREQITELEGEASDAVSSLLAEVADEL